MRWTIVLIVSAAAMAQDSPSARQILDRVRASYSGLRRFNIEGLYESFNAASSERLMHAPFRLVAEYPDKFRIDGPTPGNIMITDGKTTWRYDAPHRVYTRKAGAGGVNFSERMGLVDTFRKLPDMADRAKFVRRETLRIAELEIECYVIEAPQERSASRQTIWVDTQYRIRRIDAPEVKPGPGAPVNMIFRTTMRTVSLNEELPIGVFLFMPPPSAKQVDTLP